MTRRTISLYLQAAVYFVAGIIHFVNPGFYIGILADWFPMKSEAVFISGIAEIVLAIGLIYPKTQQFSAKLIALMLIAFLFLVHIPMLFNFHGFDDTVWWIAFLRVPLQFVLIRWAWYFAKKPVDTFLTKDDF